MEDFEPFVGQVLEAFDLPGMAIAVVHRGEVIYADGVGVKQLGHDDEIDGETLFQIGSTSKAFAAAAIAALVDEGKLGWDDKVKTHLPWFETPDPEITEETTIRQLLSHSSGIGGDIGSAILEMSPRTAAERLRLPGTTQSTRGSFLYSNAGIALTELIVEEASGRNWHEHVKASLFDPLGMTSSATSPYAIWDAQFVAPAFLGSAPAGAVDLGNAGSMNVAMPHGYDASGNRRRLSWQSYDSMAPAGSVVSNAQDMAQWLRMWLGGGAVDGRQVLSAQVIAEMTRVQVEEKDPYFLFAAEDTRDSHGFGWTISELEGRKLVYHGGGIFGFPAFVAFFPEEELGIAVLANGSNSTPYYPHQAIVGWVSQRFIGTGERDWLAEALAGAKDYNAPRLAASAQQASERQSEVAHSLPLQAYVGSYESADVGKQLGRVTVTLRGGALHFAFGKPGELSGPMEHWQSEQFRLNYEGGDGVMWAHMMGEFAVDGGQVSTLTVEMLGTFRRVED